MNKQRIISITALITSFLVIATAFSLYRQDAADKDITIRFGEIYQLSISKDGESSIISPQTDKQSVKVTLKDTKVNDDNVADDYTYGRFYVEINQETENASKLADVLEITADVDEKTIPHNELVKSGEEVPMGYVAPLGKDITLTLNYGLNETGKQNYIEYAGQRVSLTLYWVFCKITTVHVYNPWRSDKVYYEAGGVRGTLKYNSNTMWNDLIVDAAIQTIKFSNNKDFTEFLEVKLSKVDADEVWVLYGDTEEKMETVYTSNPE